MIIFCYIWLLGVLIGLFMGAIKERHWLYYLMVFIWPTVIIPLLFLVTLNLLFKGEHINGN